VIDDQSPRAGEQMHTFISLASSLAYCYKRGTVTVWGNVIDATHGETRRETLGSGNGAESFQRFTLKAAPLTYTSVPTPDGLHHVVRLDPSSSGWLEDPMPSRYMMINSL